MRKGQRLGTAKVRYRETETFPLVAGETVHAVVRRGRRAQVTVDAPDVIEGPKPAGARVGTATVRVGDRIVARVPVLTGAPVPEVGLADRLFGGLGGLVVVAVGLLAVATGSVLLAMARRRRRQSKSGKRTEVGAA